MKINDSYKLYKSFCKLDDIFCSKSIIKADISLFIIVFLFAISLFILVFIVFNRSFISVDTFDNPFDNPYKYNFASIVDINSEINSETMARKSIYGIHRDDLIIALNDKDARSFASQGQARSIILSLKLAVIRLLEDCHNDTPLVLLDDVDAELDSTRGQNFFNLILSGKNQVFLTGTEQRRALISKKNMTKSFTIEHGKLLDIT
jgi:hypothetical protein